MFDNHVSGIALVDEAGVIATVFSISGAPAFRDGGV